MAAVDSTEFVSFQKRYFNLVLARRLALRGWDRSLQFYLPVNLLKLQVWIDSFQIQCRVGEERGQAFVRSLDLGKRLLRDGFFSAREFTKKKRRGSISRVVVGASPKKFSGEFFFADLLRTRFPFALARHTGVASRFEDPFCCTFRFYNLGELSLNLSSGINYLRWDGFFDIRLRFFPKVYFSSFVARTLLGSIYRDLLPIQGIMES